MSFNVFVTYEQKLEADKTDTIIRFKPNGVYAYVPEKDTQAWKAMPFTCTIKPENLQYVYVLFSVNEKWIKDQEGNEVLNVWEILGVYDNPTQAETFARNKDLSYYVYTTELKGKKYLPEIIVKL